MPSARRLTALILGVLIAMPSASPAPVFAHAADGAATGGGRARSASIALGADFGCALTLAGVKCWGENLLGQLGRGDNGAVGQVVAFGAAATPVDLGTGHTARAITSGRAHTCVILDDHGVKCWGANNHGQLGYGDTSGRGDWGGELGDNLPEVDLGTGRTALAVSAGGNHTCALLDDHTVKCWGANESGQAGVGTATDVGDGPGEMGDSLSPVDLAGKGALEIAAGTAHTCAVDDEFRLHCWGRGAEGQLGLGSTDATGDAGGELGTLNRVSLPDYNVIGVSAGPANTCAVTAHTWAPVTTQLFCWGSGSTGVNGSGSAATLGDDAGETAALSPVDLGTQISVVSVDVALHACATTSDGYGPDRLNCWGTGDAGQFGTGSTGVIGDDPGEMGNALVFAWLTGTKNSPEGLAVGGRTTCAVIDSVSITCLGANDHGQLGNATYSTSENYGDDPNEVGGNGLLVGTDSASISWPVTGRYAPFSYVSVTPAEDGTSVSMTWPAPTDNGGEAPSGYRIEKTYDSGATWLTLVANTGSADLSAEIPASGPAGDNGIGFRVRPINSAGIGGPSFFALSCFCRQASEPLNAHTSRTAETTLTVGWDAPADNGGAAVGWYHLDMSTNGADYGADAETNDAATFAHAFAGLTPGQEYWFRVWALTANGGRVGDTATIGPVIAGTLPAAPAAGPTAVAGNASAALTWATGAAGSLPITGWRVDKSINGTDWTVATADTSSATAATTVSGLVNGTSYRFRVAAISGVGTGAVSPASSSVTPLGPPAAPATITAAGNGTSGVMRVAWAAAANGGVALTGYRIQRSINGGAWVTVKSVTAATRAWSATGLVNGTSYRFRVAAINAKGLGAYATSVAAKPYTKAGAPASASVARAVAHAIKISWGAAASHGASITGYRIQRSINGGGWVTLVANTGTTARTYTTGALATTKSYRFRVAAINAAGTGAYSRVSASLRPR